MRIRTKQVLGVLLVALLASGLFLILLGIVERGEQDLVAGFEQSGHADLHEKAMESVFDRMEYLTLLSAIAVLLGASFLGLYFVHLVVEPLEQLRDTLEGISKGSMDEEIPQPMLEREDEIGEVANAFDRLIVSMRLAMEQEEPEAIERNEELQQEVERKEDRLESILDVVSDGVLIVDLEGDTQLYNDRVASIWGLDGAVVEEDGEELWRNMAEKTATEDEFLEQVQYLLDTPEEEYTGEVVLQDGRTVGMHTKPHKEADEIVGRSFSFSVIDDNGDNGT